MENASYKHTTATYDRLDGNLHSGVNQVRDFTVDGVHRDRELTLSREHIAGLIDALREGGDLDRIDVIPNPHPEEGTEFIVVDGHHRLQAYREAHRLGLRKSKSVPIKIHHGLSLKDARLMAFRANNKNKLRMSPEQKPQEAWLTLWRHWDELKDMGGERIAAWMDGVIKKSLAADMKAVIKTMVAEDAIYKKQLNSENPDVEPWKTVRRKYDRGGQAGNLEERRLKAYVRLQSTIYRLKDSPEWRILEDDQKVQLGSLLAGVSVIDTTNEDDLTVAPW